MLGTEAGERHREVEPHADLAAAVVGEAIELLVGLGTPLAREDLEVFERRRVDRGEAEGAVDPPGHVENALAGQRLRGQMITKSLQRARLDHDTIGRRAGFGPRMLVRRFLRFRPSPISWPPGPSTASMYSSTCSAVSKYWS